MKRVGLLCAVIGIICLLIQDARVSAASPQPWVDSPITKISESSIQSSISGSMTCSGFTTFIEIADIAQNRMACVYGEVGGVQLARYLDYDNILRYVISFSSSVRFYELRNICTEAEYCVYSQSEDTAIVSEQNPDGTFKSKIVRNFSKQLERHKQASTLYFTVNTGSGIILSNQLASLTTRATAISSNGRWVVIEIPGFGLVRVEMKTGTYRWIAPLGTENGSYAEDAPNLAISNAGDLVATTGWYSGLDIYAIDASCGYQAPSRPQAVTWCPKSYVSQERVAENYVIGYGLKFSDDNKKLSIIVIVGEGAKKVFLSPVPYEESVSPRYLAFGDSFSSGEGELSDDFYLPGTNANDNRCHVSNRSYPYLLSSYWETLTTNHACSGSRIPDVRVKMAGILMNSTQSASILSIGVGGNDVDLVGKMKTCLGTGTCEWAELKNRSATISEMNRLLPNLISLITNTQSNSSVPMFIVGYPLVINSSDEASCTPLINSLLSKEERVYINESIRYLNQVIETAAQYTDIAYVDIENALSGERLCDDSEKSMNGIRYGDDIAPLSALPGLKVVGSESFHPTPRGHERIAYTIEGQLRGFWQSSSCVGCEAHTTPTSYWSEGLNVAIQPLIRFFQLFIQSEEVQSGRSVAFNFPAGTFSPHTEVVLEVHSSPQKVGTFRSDADGSLAGVFTMPLGLDGYHTVHALSTTLTEESLDIYQIVHIAPTSAPPISPADLAGMETTKPKLSSESQSLLLPTRAQRQTESASLDQFVLGSQSLVFSGLTSPTRAWTVSINRNMHEFFIYCLLAGAILLIFVTVLFVRKV